MLLTGPAKEDISTLPGSGHFYFALTRKSIDLMKPLLITDNSERMVREIEAIVAEWMPLFDEEIRQCDLGNVAKANGIRKDMIGPIHNSIDADGQLLVARQREHLNQDKVAAAELTADSRRVAFILLSLCILIGASVQGIVRNINRTLRQAVTELYRGAEEVTSAASQVASLSQS